MRTHQRWSAQDAGFSIKRKSFTGSLQMKMRGDPEPGHAQVDLKLRGDEVKLPEPMQVASPIHVRLRNELACWGADYSSPFRKQTERLLKAASD